MGALEGANKRAFGTLKPLSEQQLIDCSVGYGQLWGCNGGFIMDAMNFVDDLRKVDNQQFGLADMDAYPYTGQAGCRCNCIMLQSGKCRLKTHEKFGRNRGFRQIPVDENQLKAAVAELGPIAAGVDSTKWQLVSSRHVFRHENCSRTRLNHGVLIVGYGSDSEGQQGCVGWVTQI